MGPVAPAAEPADLTGLTVLDIEWWKRRCTLQWLIDTKTPYEIITPLYDGGEQEYGLLLPHTSDLDTKQCAELVDWILAFGATNGVTFKEPAR